MQQPLMRWQPQCLSVMFMQLRNRLRGGGLCCLFDYLNNRSNQMGWVRPEYQFDVQVYLYECTCTFGSHTTKGVGSNKKLKASYPLSELLQKTGAGKVWQKYVIHEQTLMSSFRARYSLTPWKPFGKWKVRSC